MAKKILASFFVLSLTIFTAVSSFAQNATLNCSTLTADGDNGSGSIILYTGSISAIGCCMVMTASPGTPSTAYLSASCDGPTYTLLNPIQVNSITLDARKNFVLFAPFETLVVTIPASGSTPQRVKRFPMLWNATAGEGTFSRIWNINLYLPQGTTFFIDAYFSTVAASNCAGVGCLASTVWTLN